MTQISPKVLKDDRNYLKILAPSKSQPEAPRTIQFYPSGKHHCDCPGWSWFRKRGEAYKLCRHAKMTTIPVAKSDRQFDYLLDAMKFIGDPDTALYVAWGSIQCQFPEYRGLDTVKCDACPLYPKVCNVHPTRFGSGPRNNRKPLVWKLQTAIYNGRRKEALRLVRRIKSAVVRAKAPCSRCGGRGYVGDSVECVCHPNQR